MTLRIILSLKVKMTLRIVFKIWSRSGPGLAQGRSSSGPAGSISKLGYFFSVNVSRFMQLIYIIVQINYLNLIIDVILSQENPESFRKLASIKQFVKDFRQNEKSKKCFVFIEIG